MRRWYDRQAECRKYGVRGMTEVGRDLIDWCKKKEMLLCSSKNKMHCNDYQQSIGGESSIDIRHDIFLD